MGRNYTKTNLIMRGGVGLLALTMISGLVLISNKASADSSAVSTASITVPVACTMRGEGVDSHTATLAPNTYSGASGSEYENGIGKTTLTAICNDDNGFSIYAIGFTGNEYSGENHTKLVGSTTGGTIATKAYASGDTTSNWSMKLAKVTDTTQSYNPQNLTLTTGYDSWHAVPDTYTKVAEYHANTGSSATDTTLGVKLETTYAAFIAANQPADTYTGQVKYTMVHPYNNDPAQQPQTTVPGQICYYANASDAVGTMGCQSAADGNSIDLLASNFSRTGYGFAGWSDSYDYATNLNAKFYGPQETITVPTGTTANGLSLYAVWVKSQGSIQDQSKVASICSSLTTAPTDGTANLTSVSALTDQRDNETYAIAKLADGNCWMIENMRLENTATGNTDGSLAQGYNASFAGLAAPEEPSLFDYYVTTANTIYSIDGSTDKTISGINQSYRFPRYNNVNTPTTATERPSNPTANSSTNSISDAGMYSYGNYYTWAAAIADTTYYDTNNQSVTFTSICPSGWRLPKGGQTTVNTTAEFYILGKSLMKDSNGDSIEPNQSASNGYGYYDNTPTNADGDTATKAFRKYPNNFVYSGRIDNGSVYSRGSGGHYWSSTVRDGVYAYTWALTSSVVVPGTNSGHYKYYGRTVRCVAPGV